MNKPRMNTTHISKLSLLKGQGNKDEIDRDMIFYDPTDPATIQKALANSNNCQPNLQLIPIKLDIEHEGRRLKDMFMWDKNEPYLTLEEFAKILMEEHNLPALFEQEIISNMKKQINGFRQYK